MKKSFKDLLKVIAIVSILCMAAVVICMTAFAEEDSFEPPCDHVAEFVGANISLDKDISLRYYVKLCDCYKSAKMIFSSNGKSVTRAAYYDEEADEYIFTLNRIAPQALGNLINAELICNDKIIASKENYSVLENCKNLLENHKDDEKVQYLVKALLNYGAAVQNYKDYEVDSMVNVGFEMDTLRPSYEDSVKHIENNNGDAIVKAANITFDNDNKVFIKVVCEYEPVVTANGVRLEAKYEKLSDDTDEEAEAEGDNEEEIIDGVWLFYTDSITPDKFNDVITFMIISNDPVTELTYSVNSYIYSMLDSQKASMRNLALALYTYGVAVESYLAD